MKTVIEMAREAGFMMENSAAIQAAERFAELVRADEREHIITKNTLEIERCNSHIKALEQEILRVRSTHET